MFKLLKRQVYQKPNFPGCITDSQVRRLTLLGKVVLLYSLADIPYKLKPQLFMLDLLSQTHTCKVLFVASAEFWQRKPTRVH
jgi:hypothetical protein